MQIDIFTDENIQNLLFALNLAVKEKDKFKLLGANPLTDKLILLSAYSEKKNLFLYNVVDHSGNVPNGYSVNWRNLELIIQKIDSNYIPEIILQYKMTEENIRLALKGYSMEQIDEYWENRLNKINN